VLDLPESLFDVHDVAVDFIVTPTRVIQCSGAKPRPAGIMWNLLPAERLDRVKILKRLRYREWKAGKDVRLSGESESPAELTDEIPPEDDDDRGPRRRTNMRRRPMRSRDSVGWLVIDLANAAVVVDSSHVTASSSASWGRFSPPSCLIMSLKSALFMRGPGSPSNTWFLRPNQVHIPNSFAVGSAVFAGLRNTRYLYRECSSHCRFQAHDGAIVRFVV